MKMIILLLANMFLFSEEKKDMNVYELHINYIKHSVSQVETLILKFHAEALMQNKNSQARTCDEMDSVLTEARRMVANYKQAADKDNGLQKIKYNTQFRHEVDRLNKAAGTVRELCHPSPTFDKNSGVEI